MKTTTTVIGCIAGMGALAMAAYASQNAGMSAASSQKPSAALWPVGAKQKIHPKPFQTAPCPSATPPKPGE